MHGKVVTVRHQAVTQKKDNRFAVALDSDQNNIHVKDIVKVIDGPHSVSASGCSLAESERVEVGSDLPCPACAPPLLPRAERVRSAICTAALPSCTARSWWRTGACLSVRHGTWCWLEAQR